MKYSIENISQGENEVVIRCAEMNHEARQLL